MPRAHGPAVALPAERTANREKYASGYVAGAQPRVGPRRAVAKRLPHAEGRAGAVAGMVGRLAAARNCSRGQSRTPGTSTRSRRRSRRTVEYPRRKYLQGQSRIGGPSGQAAHTGSPPVAMQGTAWPAGSPPGCSRRPAGIVASPGEVWTLSAFQQQAGTARAWDLMKKTSDAPLLGQTYHWQQAKWCRPGMPCREKVPAGFRPEPSVCVGVAGCVGGGGGGVGPRRRQRSIAAAAADAQMTRDGPAGWPQERKRSKLSAMSLADHPSATFMQNTTQQNHLRSCTGTP